MCGIAGFYKKKNFNTKRDSHTVKEMVDAIRYRGPDDYGVWLDERAGIALGHRRLSILDLSPAGGQPMLSKCERYCLTFNGEIYNHRELRKELLGSNDWKGHSDTETLLNALIEWGVEKTLNKINGMFAFAFWDKSKRRLILARDRVGEKPLYYGNCGLDFVFASELKSLMVYPGWSGEIDRDSLAQYLRYNCVPSPRAIFSGVKKLPPAHYLVIDSRGGGALEPKCYWDLASISESSITNDPDKTLNDYKAELDFLLRDSVRLRMASDVPLGAFLSGGYDSTMVAALMQAQSAKPIQTFSIGFNEKGYNEAEYALDVARHLGTKHTELYVTPDEAMGVIPMLPNMYDEPFSDSSQIPTFLVSKLARKSVTVALSGDGGDELFAGYNRHVIGPVIWEAANRLPLGARKLLCAGVDLLGKLNLDEIFQYLPRRMRLTGITNKLDKLSSALKAENEDLFYKYLVSHWKKPEQIVLGAKEPAALVDKTELMPNLPGFREKMMYLDMSTYLPDDILTKLDRASMAISLEARVPLLDHRVIEFAWKVPTEYKYRNGQGKWILRELLNKYVPRELMERPKMGFGVPIEIWLRGPLREWAEDLLSETRLNGEGYFNSEPIRYMWKEHIDGKRRWQYLLWDVLMFQSWLAAQQ